MKKTAMLPALAILITCVFNACNKVTNPIAVNFSGSISGQVNVCQFRCSCPGMVIIPVLLATSTGTVTATPAPVPAGTATPFICSIAGAPVKIMNGAKIAASVVTDASGHYKAAGLLPGVYTAEISIPGYDVFKLENITVTAGADSPGHDINTTFFYHAGEISVYFKPGTAAADETALINSLGCAVTYSNQYIAVPGIPPVLADYYNVTIPPGTFPKDMKALFQSSPQVSSAALIMNYCICPL